MKIGQIVLSWIFNYSWSEVGSEKWVGTGHLMWPRWVMRPILQLTALIQYDSKQVLLEFLLVVLEYYVAQI